MKTAIEFFTEKNGGKTPDEMIRDGESINPLFACILMEDYHKQFEIKLHTDEEIEKHLPKNGKDVIIYVCDKPLSDFIVIAQNKVPYL